MKGIVSLLALLVVGCAAAFAFTPESSQASSDSDCVGRVGLVKGSETAIEFKASCNLVSSRDLQTALTPYPAGHPQRNPVISGFSRRPKVGGSGGIKGSGRCQAPDFRVGCTAAGTGELTLTGRVKVPAGTRCEFPIRFIRVFSVESGYSLYHGRPQGCRGKRDPSV
jgi:hypothetical protein